MKARQLQLSVRLQFVIGTRQTETIRVSTDHCLPTTDNRTTSMSDHFWRDNVIQPALNNDVEEAVAEQKSILAKDPNNAKAYFALGTLSHFQGEIEQAMQYFQKSIELKSRRCRPSPEPGPPLCRSRRI